MNLERQRQNYLREVDALVAKTTAGRVDQGKRHRCVCGYPISPDGSCLNCGSGSKTGPASSSLPVVREETAMNDGAASSA